MSGLFGALGISGSGMTAERLRMDVVSENLANADTTRGVDGKPYARKEVVLQQTGGQSFGDVLAGVQGGGQTVGSLDDSGVRVAGIVKDSAPGRRVYDPSHPDADAKGYVTLPNVNSVTEMVDLITASRGYEANAAAMTATKAMFTKTLDILR